MWCGIVSIFPDMFSGFLNHGIVHQAQKKGLLQCEIWDPRDYSGNKHHAIDDRPYGGGPGMVMRAEPLRQSIAAAKAQAPCSAKVVYLSPEGKTLNTELIKKLAREPSVIFVAGRYEGIDQRVIHQDIDEMISIGDYVLSGGELAVMVVLDTIIRFIPGVLGDEASNQQDAFAEENDGLLDCPHYTRPPEWANESVPKVLLSGDHQAINRWRRKQKIGKTWCLRPDLLQRAKLSRDDLKLLEEYQAELGFLTPIDNG